MGERPATLPAQAQAILARYEKIDLGNEEDRKSLTEMIDGSNLPRVHKEVYRVVLLTKDSASVPIALQLVITQELLRHQDAIARVQQQAITARLRRVAKT